WTNEEKDMVWQMMERFLNAAHFTWDKVCGPFGECHEWTKEYLHQINAIWQERYNLQKYLYMGNHFGWRLDYYAHQLNAQSDRPLWDDYFQIQEQTWENWYIGWIPGVPGHAAIRITFNDYKTFYLDDSHLGGPGHFFLEAQIPNQYIHPSNPPASFPNNPHDDRLAIYANQWWQLQSLYASMWIAQHIFW